METTLREIQLYSSKPCTWWILAQGDFLNLLSGSTTVEQIEENVKSAELELEADDVAYMRELAEAIDKE